MGVVAAVATVGLVACGDTQDPTLPRVEKNVTYAPGLHLDIYRPSHGIAPLNAIIMIHGGGFSVGSRNDMRDYAEAFADRGYVTATIDYQLTAGSWFPAKTLTDPGLVRAAAIARSDVQLAVEWLRSHASEQRIDPGRIALLGYSAGAITAIEVASHHVTPIWAAVSISGAAIDLRAVAQPHAPMLLVHGTGDTEIPFPLAEATCHAALAGGVCLMHPYVGLGHEVITTKANDIIPFVDVWLSQQKGGKSPA
jgi:carboxylesterase type B